MKYFILVCLVFSLISSNYGMAQNNLKIALQFHNNQLKIDSSYSHIDTTSTVKITLLKFYISNLSFWNDSMNVYDFPQKHYLIDLNNLSSLNINFDIPKNISYKHIKFNVGIDSLTNMAGAKGQALDPVNGMYWTWQSGYINFKLEGTSNLCPTRKNKFQYHIGGYQYPYNSLIPIFLKVDKGTDLVLNINIDDILQEVDLKQNHTIMSPSNKGNEMALLIKRLISISSQ